MKKEYGDTFTEAGRRQGGFSLMELMIIIAIIGILSTIAIPNILSYRDNARVRAAATDILSLVRKAQLNAVKSHYNAGIDFNTAGTAIVYLDNGSGGGTANDSTQDAGEPILEQYTVPVGCNIPTAKITFLGKKVGFTPRGLPVGNIIGAVEIHSTSASAPAQYKVSVSLAGHTQLQVSTDGGTNWK